MVAASPDADGAAVAGDSRELSPPPPPPSLSPAALFQLGLASGAVAGTTVDFVLYPLDTIKTRLQVQGARDAGVSLFRGVYRGVAPAMAASAPAGAAFFGTYDFLKRTLAQWCPAGTPPPLLHVAAALGGDMAGSAVRVPFEVVKQNLQARRYRSSMEAVRAIVRAEGVRGLYRGWRSLLVREIPFDVLEFPMYEAFKSGWARLKGAELHPWESALCGSLAGGIAAGVTTPLDVVKTRLMTQASRGAGGAGAATVNGGKPPTYYRGVFDALGRITRDEGLSALFGGVVPRVLWISLGGAIFFGGYEFTKAALLPLYTRAEEQRRQPRGQQQQQQQQRF